MGLALRYGLFHGVTTHEVFEALSEFWTGDGRTMIRTPVTPIPDRPHDEYTLYQTDQNWTLLDWTAGWEWSLRRQAQFHVSEKLQCAGLLVFVYDGDAWGYELFARGQVIDQFDQDPELAEGFFPGKDARGDPGVLVETFPSLSLNQDDVAKYLILPPNGDTDDPDWDVPARSGDRYARGREVAVLDFLNLLGVRVNSQKYERRGSYVTPEATAWTNFRVVPEPE
jgi:hypothetical protein